MVRSLSFQMRFPIFGAALVLTVLVAGCGPMDPNGFWDGFDIWQPPEPQQQTTTTTVQVAAGITLLQPESTDTLTDTVDVSHLGISSFDEVYEMETPAGEDFTFSVVTRGAGNFGQSTISLAHVEAGGVQMATVQSIADEGMILDGPGMSIDGNWVSVSGDGFSRLTVRGNINTDQVMVVNIPTGNGDDRTVGLRISIGNESPINYSANTTGVAGTFIHDEMVFSSESYQCGLPAIAVSGDRYSIVSYDGNESDPYNWERNRNWLQYEPLTGAVVGGEAQSVSSDSGNWRDQEVAAKDNVLMVAYTGFGGVQVDISLDRGATFDFEMSATLDETYGWGQRLVQTEIAPDYTIGCLFWRTVGDMWVSPSSELVYVEATPTGFDAGGTPTGYSFGSPEVVFDPASDVSPLLMGLTYSDAGDTVIGFGYTSTDWDASGWTATSTTSFRCAVRFSGDTAFTTYEVDSQQELVPMDPSVAVLGSGSSMQIFYAYEKDDGVHLLHSQDAGANFIEIALVGAPGSFMPSVFARLQGTETRVDMFYLEPTAYGLELHNLHWDDYGTSQPEVRLLTEAEVITGVTPPSGYGDTMYRGVAWFGYDAVLDGDDVAIILHEQKMDPYEYMWRNGMEDTGVMGAPSAANGTGGAPLDANAQTPLAPGMTGSVAAPDADAMNVMRVLVVD